MPTMPTSVEANAGLLPFLLLVSGIFCLQALHHLVERCCAALPMGIQTIKLLARGPQTEHPCQVYQFITTGAGKGDANANVPSWRRQRA
jgi:hypothetical protein